MEKFIHDFYETEENPIAKVIKVIIMVIVGCIVAAVVIFLLGFVIQALWNWLMPAIFELPEIDYWQAIGIFILSKIIFGFGGGSGGDEDKKKKHRGRGKWGRSFRKGPWRKHGKHWGQGSMDRDCRGEGFEECEDDMEDMPPHPFTEEFSTYERFWKEEGKQAFDDFMKRVDEE